MQSQSAYVTSVRFLHKSRQVTKVCGTGHGKNAKMWLELRLITDFLSGLGKGT